MKENFEKIFVENFRLLKRSGLPNLAKGSSQKLNENFSFECYLLWKEFNNFEIIKSLNNKKILKNYGEISLVLNYNSLGFLRDANYSLSLVKNNIETAIISFLPVENKTLRIVQIQGQKGFKFEIENLSWKDILIDELKLFSYNLGFKNLEILRAEENYLIKFPRSIGPDFDMEEHRKRFLYIYNVLPVRKWKFKYKKGDFYSRFSF